MLSFNTTRLSRTIGIAVAQVLMFGLLAFWFVPQVLAAPNFSFTLLSWNLMGLDHNNVNDGPNQYPVAWRICNTSGSDMTNVQVNLVWDTTSTYINLDNTSAVSLGSLANGACEDAYFSITITRSTSAYFQSATYHITASATGVSTESSAVREIYVEKIISQNRNGTRSITGPTSVSVGSIVTYSVEAFTATNGYESWETYLNFPVAAFQILSVSLNYPKPAPGATISQLWLDACVWIEATRTCTNNSDTAGGDPDYITYTVLVTGGAGNTYTLRNNVYDFSGSSYHYNDDYSVDSITVTVTSPTAANLISFKARTVEKGIRVKWKTGSELDVLGFNVWRKTGTGAWKKVNADVIDAKNIGAVFGATYAYLDKSAKAGTGYRYKLQVLKVSGESEWSDVIRVK